MNLRTIAIVAGLSAAVATHLNATVIGGAVTGGTAAGAGGTFNILTVPLGNPVGPANSVGNNTFQTPNLYAFNEDQNIVIGAALSVDILASTGSVGSLGAGTEVASHYVFFDPGPTQSQLGYVDFDAKILAVITSTGRLAASDFLANTGVNYLNPAARGLEAVDTVSISATFDYRLLVDWNASTPGDYVRVLTERSPIAAPEGGATVALVGLALAVFAGLRRRRN